MRKVPGLLVGDPGAGSPDGQGRGGPPSTGPAPAGADGHAPGTRTGGRGAPIEFGATTLLAGTRRRAALAAGTTFVPALALHEARGPHAIAGGASALACTGHVLADGRRIRSVPRRAGRGLPRTVTVDAVLRAALGTLALLVVGTGAVRLAAGGTRAAPVPRECTAPQRSG